MQNTIDKLNANVLSKIKVKQSDREEIKLPSYTLFKPPKNDTEYFYYTKINNDWFNEN